VRGDHTELEQQSETENFSRVLAVTAINGLSDLGFVSDSVSTPLASTDQSAEVVPELSTSDAQGSHLVVPMNDLMSAAVSAGSVIAIAGPSAPRMDCGHTSRAVTPQVESQVRRCTRNHNDGNLYEIPNQPTRRGASSVPRATSPAILQISEMQRLGVEQWFIDPDELTEDRLLQDRED
jgi:hypothetical protein